MLLCPRWAAVRLSSGLRITPIIVFREDSSGRYSLCRVLRDWVRINFGPHIDPSIAVSDEMVFAVVLYFLIKECQNGLLLMDIGLVGEVSREMGHSRPKEECGEGIILVIRDHLVELAG